MSGGAPVPCQDDDPVDVETSSALALADQTSSIERRERLVERLEQLVEGLVRSVEDQSTNSVPKRGRVLEEPDPVPTRPFEREMMTTLDMLRLRVDMLNMTTQMQLSMSSSLSNMSSFLPPLVLPSVSVPPPVLQQPVVVPPMVSLSSVSVPPPVLQQPVVVPPMVSLSSVSGDSASTSTSTVPPEVQEVIVVEDSPKAEKTKMEFRPQGLKWLRQQKYRPAAYNLFTRVEGYFARMRLLGRWTRQLFRNYARRNTELGDLDEDTLNRSFSFVDLSLESGWEETLRRLRDEKGYGLKFHRAFKVVDRVREFFYRPGRLEQEAAMERLNAQVLDLTSPKPSPKPQTGEPPMGNRKRGRDGGWLYGEEEETVRPRPVPRQRLRLKISLGTSAGVTSPSSADAGSAPTTSERAIKTETQWFGLDEGVRGGLEEPRVGQESLRLPCVRVQEHREDDLWTVAARLLRETMGGVARTSRSSEGDCVVRFPEER